MGHHRLVVQGESHLLAQFSFYFHRPYEFQLLPLQGGDPAYPMQGRSHQSKTDPWETIAKETHDQWFLLSKLAFGCLSRLPGFLKECWIIRRELLLELLLPSNDIHEWEPPMRIHCEANLDYQIER